MRLTAMGLSGLALLLGSCSTPAGPPTRSAEAQQRLNEALAGRTAGPPVQCLGNYRAASDMRVIDDWTLLFGSGHTIYLQTPRGGCPGLASFRNTLVTQLRGSSQLCNGDINRIVDLSSGIGGGACVFGPFVPYTKAD